MNHVQRVPCFLQILHEHFALITLTSESMFYYFIPYFCSQWLNVPHFYCLKEHLEDKHLRQILLDAETSTFYDRPETDPPSGQGAKK